jgi:hypothetical protein
VSIGVRLPLPQSNFCPNPKKNGRISYWRENEAHPEIQEDKNAMKTIFLIFMTNPHQTNQ